MAGDETKIIPGHGAVSDKSAMQGDLDVLITQVSSTPVLLRNDQDLNHHWLRLRLKGRGANLDAIGARVVVEAGGVIRQRQVMPTRSYLSQVELPVTFGLGSLERADVIRVHWPDGTTQELRDVVADQFLVVEQSSG